MYGSVTVFYQGYIMRFILFCIFTLLWATSNSVAIAEEFPADCSTPEHAIKSLLKNLQTTNWNRIEAAKCVQQNEKVAVQIKQIFDAKGIFIDYSKIPNDANFQNDNLEAMVIIDPKIPDIYLEKIDDSWQISTHSIERVHDIYSDTFSVYVKNALEKLPVQFFEMFLGIQLWQYLLFFIILILSWMVGRLVDKLIYSQLFKYIAKFNINFDPNILLPLRRPIVWLTISVFFLASIPDLQLPLRLNQVLYFVSRLILSFSSVMLCSRIIDLLSDIFMHKASTTASKLDDQLVPLVRRAGKTLVWVLGCVFILQNMGIEVTALVAFGSVGGVAIALASKDTVENLFGSVVVFIDQPFQIGDFVNIDGSIEGVVEEVGFRSTRIRTLDKTVISIPNGTIAHAVINNYAKRTERRLQCVIGLRYDTPPEKIEEYIAKLKEYITSNTRVRADSVNVHFSALNSYSLDINIILFVASPDWIALAEFKHEAFLQFLRIAKEVGVGFAFPTTTVEVENQPNIKMIE